MVSRRRRRAPAEQGFTLLEVLMALLIGMIGLLGTVAVQQTMLRATKNANDAAIAMRLAAQKMEEFNAAVTNQGPPIVDELAARHAESGALSTWIVDHLDVNGKRNPVNQSTPEFRWRREWQVFTAGVNAPYRITVKVTYDLDTGQPRTVQIDALRRKTW